MSTVNFTYDLVPNVRKEFGVNKRKRKLRRLIGRTSDRVSAAMLIAAALGLFAIVLCLEVIGPPPQWRIDALWVKGHSRAVRLLLAAGLVAITCSFVPFVLPGRGRESRRALIVLLWITVAIACAALYWDRLAILYDVLQRYSIA